MKRILLTAAMLLAAFVSLTAGDCCSSPQEWKARMMERKVAFITEKLSLTPAEAKKFWPMYSEMSERRDETFKAAGEAFRQLDEAVREGRGSAEIEKLFDAYMAAQAECGKIGAAEAKAYRKVLPKEKVARLFVIEENFRRHMISRLGKGAHP